MNDVAKPVTGPFEKTKGWLDWCDKPSKPSVSYVPCIHASGNDVFLAWVDTRDGNEEEYVKVSHDRGVTWGKDVRLANHPGNSWASSLAAAGDVGAVSRQSSC